MSSAKSRPSAITRPHGTSKHPPSFSSSWTRVYGYDRYGNRISESTGGTPTPIQVDSGDNRLTGPGIVYDAAGNLTQNGAREYLYDAENRLVLILENGDLVAQYYYDGDGRRIKKLVVQPGQPTKRTRFVYNGGGQLVAEYEGTAPEPTQPTREYVYGPSGMLVVIEGTERKYMTADHLGSPRAITDASGTVMSRRDNLPFGEDLPAGIGGRTAAEGYSVPDDVRFRFTSFERDDETGLDFAQARYYGNMGGRFLSADPFGGSGKVGNPQSWNRYTYVRNNPLIIVDPSGMSGYSLWVDYYDDEQQEKQHQEQPPAGGFLGPIPGTGTSNGQTSGGGRGGGIGGGAAGVIGFGIEMLIKWSEAEKMAAEAELQMEGQKAINDVIVRERKKEEGTAIVSEYEGPSGLPHFTIAVLTKNLILETDQIIVGDNTTIRMTPPDVEGTLKASYGFILPSGDSAIAKQLDVIGKPGGKYNVYNNSCVTHVCDILRAGGLPAPTTLRGGMQYIRSGIPIPVLKK